jgi:hypothetical protein
MFDRFRLRAGRKTARLDDPQLTDEYLITLADCVDAARLNDLYPPTAAVLNTLEMMMHELHGGIHEVLEIDQRTGLPTYREYVRVASDRSRAPEELPRLGAYADREQSGIYGKLAAKREYYRALIDVGPLMGETRKTYFRKVDAETSRAMFRIVLDRIGSTSLVERLTVELSQHAGIWGREGLKLDDDDAVHMSEELGGLVYRLSSQDVEAVFLRLSDDPSLRVESVIKGTIGPFLFAGLDLSERLIPLVEAIGDGAVLCAGLALAGLEQRKDVFNDPLVSEAKFSIEARGELAESREMEPYHVLADRKFVLAGADRELLASYLERAGTSNIVYEV